MSDPRPTVISVLRDELGYCVDMELVRGYSSFQAAWEEETSPENAWWWINTFEGNPAVVRRMRDAYHEIPRAFADLEKLCRAATGNPTAVHPRIVKMIQRRVLTAWYESSYDVLGEAKGLCPERAAASIKKHVSLQDWLTKYPVKGVRG